MITLEKLPPSMKKRAVWARKEILENPEKAEIDEDELLAWVYHKGDKVWYSIDGNYSYSSPEEKMKKRRKREKEQLNWEKRIKEISLKRESEQRYYSKVREKILRRDNRTCQKCNRKIKKLQVHHIVKTKEGRVDADDNLITVCHSCHKKLDGKEYGLY